jgi:glycosyltransferase involved in cell wall biosynthesis
MTIKTIFLTRNGLLEPLGQSQVLRYAEGLSQEFNISVISFEKKRDLQNTNLLEEIKSQCAKSRIKWMPNKFTTNLGLFSTIFDLMVMVLLCFKEIQKGSSLIHARSYIPACAAMIVGKLTGTKYIFDMRALWPEELITAKRVKRGSFLHKLVVFIEKAAIKNAASVITLTNVSFEYLNKLYPLELKEKPCDVIPTCADLDKFTPMHSAKKDFIIGCSGTLLSGWFDIKKLAIFYAYAANKNKKLIFEITTKDNPKEVLDILKQYNLPLERLKIFSAEVSEMPQVNQLQTASTLFYKGHEVSELGRSPTRMAEVLGCGNPVIANSGVGDVANIIKKYNVGILLDKLDRQSLRVAYQELIELMEDPELSSRCRNVAEMIYSLSQGINSYTQIYKSVLKK